MIDYKLAKLFHELRGSQCLTAHRCMVMPDGEIYRYGFQHVDLVDKRRINEALTLPTEQECRELAFKLAQSRGRSLQLRQNIEGAWVGVTKGNQDWEFAHTTRGQKPVKEAWLLAAKWLKEQQEPKPKYIEITIQIPDATMPRGYREVRSRISLKEKA